MASASRAQYTQSQPKSVQKAFVFEVPNFMQEASLLARARVKRNICSPVYSFTGFGFTLSGSITIKFMDGILEFVNEVAPGNHRGVCPDVECSMDIILECEGFRHKCVEQSKGSPYELLRSNSKERKHCWSTSVPLSELELATARQFGRTACLKIGVSLAVSDSATTTSKAETAIAESPPDVFNLSGSSPFLKHMLDKKHSDLVIECDGQQFPAHSVVLQCMSPVFTAMLGAGLNEAVTGRIKIADVTSGAVERMLEFIYNGKLTLNRDKNGELSDDLMTQLLHCADKYDIIEMKQHVVAQMKIQFCNQNALKFLQAAELYGGEDTVLAEMMEFCKKNLMELPKGPELQEFIVKNLKKLF